MHLLTNLGPDGVGMLRLNRVVPLRYKWKKVRGKKRVSVPITGSQELLISWFLGLRYTMRMVKKAYHETASGGSRGGVRGTRPLPPYF